MELALTNATYGHYHDHNHNHHHRYGHIFTSIVFPKSASFSSLRSVSFQNPNYERQLLTNPKPPSFFFNTTFITGVTVAAIFLSRFTVKPAIAVSYPHPTTVGSKTFEEHEHEHRVDDLKTIMEAIIKKGKVEEAIGILAPLVNLEPQDHSQGQLLEDVESRRGLVAKLYDLEIVENRILEGMEICEKWIANSYDFRMLYLDKCRKWGAQYHLHWMYCYKTWRKMDHIRDLKLMVAQIHVIHGNYNDALKIYQELSEEEPEDLKPYICQGIIYTLLGKKDDAESSFVKVEKVLSGLLMSKWDYLRVAYFYILAAIVIGLWIKEIWNYIIQKSLPQRDYGL